MRIWNLLPSVLLVVLLLAGRTALASPFADHPANNPPVAPLICPSGQPVGKAICADEALMNQLLSLERRYFLASWGGAAAANTVRRSWYGQFAGCSKFAEQPDKLHSCIADSFKWFEEFIKAADSLPEAGMRKPLYAQAVISATGSRMSTVSKLAQCIETGAWELDDGVTAARDVAIAVLQRCRGHARDIVRLTVAGYDLQRPLAIEPMTFSADDMERVTSSYLDPDEALGEVLEARSKKRNKGARPTAPK